MKLYKIRLYTEPEIDSLLNYLDENNKLLDQKKKIESDLSWNIEKDSEIKSYLKRSRNNQLNRKKAVIENSEKLKNHISTQTENEKEVWDRLVKYIKEKGIKIKIDDEKVNKWRGNAMASKKENTIYITSYLKSPSVLAHEYTHLLVGNDIQTSKGMNFFFKYVANKPEFDKKYQKLGPISRKKFEDRYRGVVRDRTLEENFCNAHADKLLRLLGADEETIKRGHLHQYLSNTSYKLGENTKLTFLERRYLRSIREKIPLKENKQALKNVIDQLKKLK